MHPIIFLPMFMGVLIFVAHFFGPKGSIEILKDPDGTSYPSTKVMCCRSGSSIKTGK
ncbi:MAG TPA: hypothetical protein PK830_08245 [Candidatus Atribacteria bacterium]|nr:hypothetical protein [Candidatus Atribacteria bacterium]HPT79077.1 hypothetical protein [Candidatus Atribacteria bacterium]